METLTRNQIEKISESLVGSLDDLVRDCAQRLSFKARGLKQGQTIPTDPEGRAKRIASDILDQYQVAGFQLAHMKARVEACRALLGHMTNSPTEIDVLLAGHFIHLSQEFIRAEICQHAQQYDLEINSLRHLWENPEFLKFQNFFLNNSTSQKIANLIITNNSFGNDALDEHFKMVRQTFRSFAEQKVRPLAEHIHRKDLIVPDEIISGLAELGCFGLSIPEEFGGLLEKPDSVGTMVVTEELSRGALFAGSLVTRPEIISKALLVGGTEKQKQKFLPLIASGEKMCAVAVTEPDFGSNVAGLKLKATATPGGYYLDGVKTWCTFGGRAEIIGVLARTDSDPKSGHKGLSLFLVEKEKSINEHDFDFAHPQGRGRLSGRSIGVIGYRGLHSFELHFENYFVPNENLIGEASGLNKGFYFQMAGFSAGRLQTAARAVGVMQASLETAWTYAQARAVFDKTLVHYPLMLKKLIDMTAITHASRQFTYAVCKLIDLGRGQMEASLVKLFTCRIAENVSREAMQIHGGMGYAEEFAVSRYFVDARVLGIFEGAEEVLALKVILPELLN